MANWFIEFLDAGVKASLDALPLDIRLISLGIFNEAFQLIGLEQGDEVLFEAALLPPEETFLHAGFEGCPFSGIRSFIISESGKS